MVNFSIYKGNHKSIPLRFYQSDGETYYDLTSWSFTFNVSTTYEDATPDIELDSANSPLEIDLTDYADGLIVIKLVPGDTSSLAVATYKYDLRAVDANSEMMHHLVGEFKIKNVVKV